MRKANQCNTIHKVYQIRTNDNDHTLDRLDTCDESYFAGKMLQTLNARKPKHTKYQAKSNERFGLVQMKPHLVGFSLPVDGTRRIIGTCHILLFKIIICHDRVPL